MEKCPNCGSKIICELQLDKENDTNKSSRKGFLNS